MADEIEPQAFDEKMGSLAFKLLNSSYYYEWDGTHWQKLKDSDPEPPADLPPGRFDGQVTEVPKN
jgi:hypothetical protein